LNNKQEVQKFSRYEFKYLIGHEQSISIEKEIKPFMEYDGHISEDLGNAYFVRSEYYDNDLFTHFYEKVDGMRERYKYRIRTYGKETNSDNPIFLEKKGRKLQRTYKQRIEIHRKDLEHFYALNQAEELLDIYPGVDLIQGFVFDVFRRSISPKIIVDYLRTPYVSDYDVNFRLTFDRSLAVAKTEYHEYNIYNNERAWFNIQSGYTVLEVKFFRRFPPWFHRIIQSYGLRRLSFSKFSTGMEACGFAEDTGL
jgi:SPX domain protein involved in polyphosphate accumulation